MVWRKLKVNLQYGNGTITINVPGNTDVITPSFLPGLDNVDSHAHSILSKTSEVTHMQQLLNPHSRVAIVVNDITRPAPSEKIFWWLYRYMKNIADHNITIIIATGSHRVNTRDELIKMLGDEIVERFTIINHDAFDSKTLTYTGHTASNEPVYLNSDYCKADIRIVTGFIEPHFFAGYSGGPKAVMPGIAGIDSIMCFHNAARIDHPESNWGVLDNNPVQDMAVETALMAKPHLSVNVTLNSRKEITGIFAGDVISSHRHGAEFVSGHAMQPCRGNYDLVITTNSGYPLDQSLYQSVKGMSAAAGIVRKGGTILCAAECSDGIPQHGEFGKMLMEGSSPGELLSMIRQDGFRRYDQWQVQALCKILEKASVHLYSTLPAKTVQKVHLLPCDDVQTCIDTILTEHDDCRVAVLPEGPMVIPYAE